MKPKIIIALLVIILTSCAPVAEPIPTETPVPTVTFTPVPTSTVTPITATMLPLQPTSTPNPTQEKQQEEIKSVIQAYFEIHYSALSVSPPEDFQQNGFGDLVSDEPEAKDFLVTEMGKLAVERKHYELNKLRYVEYEYSLDYKDIVVDE
jgi:PBP1b-binding outer membrane lipoprotein LpoB